MKTVVMAAILSVSLQALDQITPEPMPELIENGSFEVFTGGNGYWLNVPGWIDTHGGNALEIRGVGKWAPDIGLYSCTLHGLGADKVTQTVDTVPGELYELNFAWKPRGTRHPDILKQYINVEWDGVLVYSDTMDSIPEDPPYMPVTLLLEASAESTELSFYDDLASYPDLFPNTGGERTVGSVIDSVSLVPFSSLISSDIGDLADDVVALNLQSGIENSLDAKLDSAVAALDDLNIHNDPMAAEGKMQAFENAVAAQSGKQIPVAVADDLLVKSVKIRFKLALMY